jgi:thiol:disulfide interchange protein/DsbC/DsbD-like thiol-disulfide interchange protein
MTLGHTTATLAALCLVAGAASAAESPPVTTARATATLVTDTDHVQSGAPFHAGLRLRMAPGWHTYWLNPGDAGTSPELSFTLPPGAKASDIAWPAPERVAEGPVVTYSYATEILLPVTITPPAGDAAPLHLAAHANWLVCEKICVPEEGNFILDLPPGPPAPSAEAPLFAATAARTPVASPFLAHIAPDGTLAVTGPGLGQATVASATFFPDAWGPIDQSAPETLSYLPDGIALHLRPGQGFKPDSGVSGLLALTDRGGQASYYTIAAKPGGALAAADAPAASPTGAVGWPRALLFAVLGGLILNLMPCVFPVLAMKAVAFARMSGAERSHARTGAWAYLAGVVLGFALLGGALAAARAAGSAAGWGFQFQSPAFVAGTALVLFAIGLNLSGVFSITGGRIAGAGQSLASRAGYVGDFFTGVLAVVVATPCTAPFMAAAIAVALAAPTWALLAIFMLMGIGLASPYVLLAEIPAVARSLPRPGPWMEVLRGILAFPMYGACAWLVWVLSQQAGSQGLLAVLAALILVAFAAWAIRLSATSGRGGTWLGRGAATAALAGCIALIAAVSQLTPPQAAQAAESGIEAYTPARLAALRAEGRPVFVNMTAAWCVTCLVNERIALSPAPVRAAFASRHVAYLKGDWTRQDPAISAFLRTYGRDGVPLYLFYPAGAAQPEVLPQILTERTVLDALDGAGS